MAPPPPPLIALFPPAPNIKLVTNKKLQDALDAATGGLSKKGYGLTIVDTGSAAADARSSLRRASTMISSITWAVR